MTADLYPYTPNQTLCIVAAGLFGISANIHIFMMIKKRTWFYTPMVIGALMMTGGYAIRLLSARNPDKLMYYVGQSLLILLPPSQYAATIYMIYGRIVLFVNAPEASLIRSTSVTKIFVVGDVLSFFVQSGGGGMTAQAGKEDLGEKVLLVGLGLQLLFFGFFLIIAIVFDRRMSGSPMRYTIPLYGKHNWRKLLLLLLAAAVLIIARCLYRVAEFSMARNGYLVTHEIFMVIGDTAPMFLVQTMFHLVHAGDVFPRNGELGKSENGSYINLHDWV